MLSRCGACNKGEWGRALVSLLLHEQRDAFCPQGGALIEVPY